jgi:hypothetical protein
VKVEKDKLTGKWYRARWKASLDEISKPGGIVVAPPDTHGHLGATSGFQALRTLPALADGLELHPHLAAMPRLDDLERSLVRVFLRRYVT